MDGKSFKYHGHQLVKILDFNVTGGSYYKIYKDGKMIATAWTCSNAKEFIDSFDGTDYHWNVLC